MEPSRDLDDLLFFDRSPDALPLYLEIRERLLEAVPDARIVVHKTQINFEEKRAFAYVSLPFRRRKEWPDPCLFLSFGLDRCIAHPRIVETAHPRHNRWTHHVLISRQAGPDALVLEWIMASHQFSWR